MTTPADELRAAAKKLRSMLADSDLTAGPWLSMDNGDRLLRNQPGDEDQAPIYVVNEPMTNAANAAYTAAMHPGVGAALADWLEETASEVGAADGTEYALHPNGGAFTSWEAALAVARTINGS